MKTNILSELITSLSALRVLRGSTTHKTAAYTMAVGRFIAKQLHVRSTPCTQSFKERLRDEFCYRASFCTIH